MMPRDFPHIHVDDDDPVIDPPVPPVKPPPVEPPPVKPPIDPPVTPTTPAGVVLPKGKVTTFKPGTRVPYGVDWSRAAEFVPHYVTWGKKTGVDPLFGIAIGLVETQWTHFRPDGSVVRAQPDGWGGGVATGIMQIKDGLWADRVKGQSIETIEGNIAIGMTLLADWIKETGSWQGAVKKYHPGEDPRSGTTPQTYVDTVAAIFREMAKAEPDVVVQPPGKPVGDVYMIMTGGVPYAVDFGFGESGPDFYAYGVGHGAGLTRSTHHTGDDIKMPLNTKIYTPLSGVVLCVGTNGTGAWGQVCGSFVDELTRGAGNLTILTDVGLKLTFGHAGKPFVRPGERVAAGQLIALCGGAANTPHIHFDVAIKAPEKVNRNIGNGVGDYWLVDPKPAIAAALGQVVVPKPLITGIHWEGTDNKESRNGIVPAAIVFHVTDDMSYTNVRDWFKNRSSRASAHWVVDREGTKHQFVGSAEAAWTNGEVRAPRRDIDWLNRALDQHFSGRSNINKYTLTIENVGKPGVPFEDAQIEANIEIARYYTSIYPIPVNRGHFLRHADIDSVNRPYCPGDLFPLRDIILACGGDPVALNP
jgi:hypothetical protein